MDCSESCDTVSELHFENERMRCEIACFREDCKNLTAERDQLKRVMRLMAIHIKDMRQLQRRFDALKAGE